MVTYIDVDKISKIFKNYRLNEANIFDFFINEDNDNFKYLLKLYILSTLEEYKHFDKLVNSVYYDKVFFETPPEEIINKQSLKKFWKILKERENITFNIQKSTWVYSYFFEYVIYLEERTNYEKEKEAFIQNKKSFCSTEKIKASYKLLKYYLKLEKKRKKIEESYIKYFGSLNGFDEINRLASYSKQHIINFEKNKAKNELSILKYEIEPFYIAYINGEITKQELIDKYNSLSEKQEEKITQCTANTNLYNYESIINRFARNYFDESNLIDFLKVDILFNYYMLTRIFDIDFLQEDDISKILFNIRKIMSDYNPNSKDKTMDAKLEYNGLKFGENPLRTEYRINNVARKNYFYKQTATAEEIEQKMQELFSDYERITQIENDDEYAFECYKLSQKFVQIHPYGNGNGRTSKYLLDTLLLKRNILPFTITDSYFLPSCYLSSKDSPEKYYQLRKKMITKRSCL